LKRSAASYWTQWPAPGNDFETRAELDAALAAGTVVEMGVGGGVAISPDPVEPRPQQRKDAGERVASREPPALHASARSVLRLDVDREFVDPCRSAIIITARLWRTTASACRSEAGAGNRSSAVGWRTSPSPFEPTTVNVETRSPSAATWPPAAAGQSDPDGWFAPGSSDNLSLFPFLRTI
jgi:hypothetical protein